MEEKGGLADGMRVVVHGLQARGDLNGQEGTLVEYDYDQGRWRVRMDDGSGKLLRAVNLKPCTELTGSSQALPSPVGAVPEVASPEQHAANASSDLVPGMRVRIVNLKARSDLNGKEGELREYVEDEERWKVWMEDGFGKMLRPGNLEILPPLQNAGSPTEHKTGVLGASMPEVAMPNLEHAPEMVSKNSNAAEPPSFQPGQRIRIVGLTARTDLNGLEGIVVQWDDDENRWRVKMSDGSGKSLKACNMQLIAVLDETAADEEAKVQALSSAAQNSAVATNDSSQVDAVRAADSFSPGKRIRAVGLQERSELNGFKGTVVEYDDSQSRWKVRLDDGPGLLLKSANMELLPAAENTSVDKTTSEQDDFAPGKLIRVHGLKARPDLNGQEGTLVEWDDDQGRWKVKMKDGTGKMFRTVNIELLPGAPEIPATPSVEPAFLAGDHVCVVGLNARPEWNGLKGTVVEFDDGEGRWKVRMEDGSGKMLKQQNLQRISAPETNIDTQFSAGLRVRAVGLVARPDLNGLEGSLVAWEESEARWKVKMDTGAQLMLKPNNLELTPTQEVEEKTETGLCQADIEASWAAFSVHAPEAVGGEGEQAEFKSGQIIRVVGLKSRSDLNGLEGTVVQWEEGEGRWKVRMADGSGKMLRSCNMELLQEQSRTSDDASFSAGREQVGTSEEPARSSDDASFSPDRATPQTYSFSPGQRIRVHGLKAKPELNGMEGSLVQWEQDENRWKVRMSDGSGKMLKESNMEPLTQAAEAAVPAVESPDLPLISGQRVSVFGLEARSDLNGLEGTLLEESDGRWKVHMDDGSGKMFKPCNLKAIPAVPKESLPKAELVSSPPDDSSGLSGERPASGVAGDTLSVGQRVRVSRLKARSDLNGSEGTLVEFDGSEARWKVRMADGSGKMLKACNLEVVSADAETEAAPAPTQKGVVFSPGQRIRVVGLKAKPELNGFEGTVVQWDEGEARWKVRMLDGSGKMFKESNMEPMYSATTPSSPSPPADASAQASKTQMDDEDTKFSVNQRVSVVGLKVRPELNGQTGTVVEWDDDQGRWKIRMDDGSGKLFKSSNLEAERLSPPIDKPISPTSPTSTVNQSAEPTRSDIAGGSAGSGDAAFQPGQRVRVLGLKARPDLNGQEGTIVDWCAVENRWKVIMADGRDGKLLKPQNMELVREAEETRPPPMGSSATTSANSEPTGGAKFEPGQPIRVVGLISRPDLNGTKGEVVEWDEFEQRWKVLMEDGTGKMLKPINMEAVTPATMNSSDFAPGLQVRVTGLYEQTELNGLTGTIVGWEEGEGRWKVHLTDGSGRLLKQENLALVSESKQPPAAEGVADGPETNLQEKSALSPGQQVVAVGLQARPDLNGLEGTVVQWDDMEGRWKVRMADGSGKMFKSQNLIVKSVSIIEVEHAPSANTTNVIPEGEASFTPGQQVRVVGLVARPDLNGLEGSIVDWDETQGRWKVRMADGSGKMFKPDNLQTASATKLATPVGAGSEERDESPTFRAPVAGRALAADAGSLRPGVEVRVKGLQARPELNGACGTIVQWDEIEQRWKVRMADGSGKMFRPANIETISAATAERMMATSSEQPLLASAIAPSEGAASIRPGVEVCIVGLKARPELNGLCGTVVEWDETEMRWKVRMTDGSGKMLKSVNLEEVIPASARDNRTTPAHSPEAAGRAPENKLELETHTAEGNNLKAAKGFDALRPGVEVCIVGLQARPELNGLRGKVVEWDETEGRWKVRMDDGSGKMLKAANLRITSVSLGEAESTSTMQAARARAPEDESAPNAPSATGSMESPAVLAPGAEVRVFGLQARPELNGQSGRIVAWDETEARWKVRMDDGSGKMLKAVNLQAISTLERASDRAGATSANVAEALRPGVEVRIRGLQARPDLNGLCGQVVEWDETESRWKVRMADGSGKMLRPANLEIISASTGIAESQINSQEAAPEDKPVQRPVSETPSAKGIDEFGPGVQVRIAGLHARPELNGLCGTIVEWDESNARWKVRMDDGSGKMFKPANLERISASATKAGTTATSPDAVADVPAVASADNAGMLRPGVEVRVVGLHARPELNGLRGTIERWEEIEGRWRVCMADLTAKMFRPVNLEPISATSGDGPLFPSSPQSTVGPGAADSLSDAGKLRPGDRVRIEGLQARPELNGLCGTTVEFDVTEGRWRVRMDDGSGKMLRAVNLEAITRSVQRAQAPSPVNPTSGQTEKQMFDNVMGMLGGTTGGTAAATSPPRTDLPPAQGPGSQKQALENILAMCEAAKGAAAQGPDAERQALMNVIAMCEAAKGGGGGGANTGQPFPKAAASAAQETDPEKQAFQSIINMCEAAKAATAGPSSFPKAGVPPCAPDNPMVGQNEQETLAKILALLGGKKDGAQTAASSSVTIEELPEEGPEVPASGAPVAAQPPASLAAALPQSDAELRPGLPVRIVGLQARPDLNGLCGTLVQWDESEARWKVRMDNGSGKMLRAANLEAIPAPAATVENMVAPPSPGAGELRPGVEVRVVGLQARPELNGLCGKISQWDESEGRWKVRMADGSGKMLRPANLETISTGTAVSGSSQADVTSPSDVAHPSIHQAPTVQEQLADSTLGPGVNILVVGLQARPELNGQGGTIVEWAELEGRWKVRMNDGTGKMLRAANLKPSVAPVIDEVQTGRQAPETTRSMYETFKGATAAASSPEAGTQSDTEKQALQNIIAMCEAGGSASTKGVAAPSFSQDTVLTASSSVDDTSKLAAALQGCSTADQVLSLCKNRQANLSVVDVAQAFRELARCPDCGVRRADSRLMDLLGHLRELLKGPKRPSPAELVKLLDALVEFDLQSIPLLKAVLACMEPQLGNFGSSELAKAAASLAELRCEDLQVFDSIASEATARCTSFAGDEVVCLLRAFAKLRLRHSEMLHGLAIHLVQVLPGMSDVNFSRAAAALARLQALSGRAIDAVSSEAAQRASRLQLSEIFQVATALAPAGQSQEATLRLLSNAASKLIAKPEEVPLEESAAALDAMPWLRPRLSGPLFSKVDESVALLRGASLELDEACILAFREIGVEFFGIMGTRCILTELGVKPWHGPAPSLETNPADKQTTAASSSSIPQVSTCTTVVRMCSTAIVEYRFETEVDPSARGTFTKKESALSTRQPWLRPAFLSSRPHSMDPESCPLFQALGELCLQAAGEAATERAAEARDRLRRRGVSGQARLWLSEVPGLSSLLALRHMQILLPEVSLQLGMSGEPL